MQNWSTNTIHFGGVFVLTQLELPVFVAFENVRNPRISTLIRLPVFVSVVASRFKVVVTRLRSPAGFIFSRWCFGDDDESPSWRAPK